jgi:membrane-associated phospholipid phosphatase
MSNNITHMSQTPNQKYARYLQALSNILHPLLMLTYAAILIFSSTYLCMLPTRVKLLTVSEVLTFTCLMPIACILLLYKFNIVGHWALRNRADRALPLLINAVAYGVCTFLLHTQGLPQWALTFYIGATILAFICWAISFWWKISAHAAGIGGAMTVSYILYRTFPLTFPLWLPLLLIVLTGLLCSIRVYLGRHTMAQVLAGTLLSIVVISTTYWLLG